MRKFIIALVIILGFALPAQAQERPKGPVYKAAKIAFWAGHGADLMSTGRCIGAQTCREVNPLLAPMQDHAWALGAGKMGLAAMQGYALDKLYQKKPKLATALAFTFGGLSFYIAHRNSK